MPATKVRLDQTNAAASDLDLLTNCATTQDAKDQSLSIPPSHRRPVVDDQHIALVAVLLWGMGLSVVFVYSVNEATVPQKMALVGQIMQIH